MYIYFGLDYLMSGTRPWSSTGCGVSVGQRGLASDNPMYTGSKSFGRRKKGRKASFKKGKARKMKSFKRKY